MTPAERAYAANVADLFADMRERFDLVTDQECTDVLASLSRLRLAADLFASAIDAERKALVNVIRTSDRNGASLADAANVMRDRSRELACDALALDGNATALVMGDAA